MAVNAYAAIVIGAAGITMRIYEINKKIGIKQIDEIVHPMHCGQEIYVEGRLSFESVDEICSVLEKFQLKVQEYGVDNVQLCMTYSLTDAFNLDFLVTQIRIKTGMKARVLNQSKDHYLTLQSVAHNMKSFNELIVHGTLILDVGYGNIQVTLYDRSELVSAFSHRLGLARIRGMVGELAIQKKDYARLSREMVTHFLQEIQEKLKGREIRHLIVIGGEMSYLNRLVYNGDAKTYSQAELAEIYEQILHDDPKLKLEDHHALLLIPLCVMVQGFMTMTQTDQMYTLDVHLCDGMVSEYAYKKFKVFSGHHFTQDRMSTAIHLAERLGCDMKHNLYVRDIAKVLFKAVSKPYGLSHKDEQVLELAAIMHNCGRFVNLTDDTLSYTIVKNSEFINLSDLNRLLIANVLRYQHGLFPHHRDLDEPLVNQDFYVILSRVTALFRLAESLDICHLQKLDGVRASIKNKEFIVRVSSSKDALIEKQAFKQNAQLFQEVFGLKPVLKFKRRLS